MHSLYFLLFCKFIVAISSIISYKFNCSALNPIRSGLFQTANDPYNLENYCVNLHHIIHVYFARCFRHVPIGIFQKFVILTILQQFQNKK